MVFPLFIPTKKRQFNCSLIKMLAALTKEELGKFTSIVIVVEKEDFPGYHELFPQFNYIVLPQSEQGIAYVRNHIKKHCEGSGIKWFWMMDDDITGFLERVDKTMKKREPAEVLLKCQEVILSQPNIAQGSLEYQQLAWSQEKEFKLNSYNDVCVLINTELSKDVEYRAYVAMKEDRDFTMQLISKGFDVCRVTRFGFAAPKNGSNAGGLKEIAYDVQGREEIAVARMIETWGDRICVPLTKPDGRKDVKIYWKEIRSKQTSLFG